MKPGIECLNSCIYNWLINDGIDISMSDIYFLGNGFKLNYTGSYGTHMIYTQQYEANKKFIRKYAIDSIWDNYIEEDNVNKKTFLINMLEEHRRIIIRLSSSALPYNRKFARNREVSHYITITGYEKKHFTIYDACSPDSASDIYSGEIDEEDLLNNWNTYNNEYLILKYKRDMFNKFTIKENVIRNRNVQIKEYLKTHLFSVNKRRVGYRCFTSLLEDMQGILGNDIDVKNIFAECNRQLRIEGFEQSKKFMLDNIYVSHVGYAEIVKQWDKLIMNMFKAGIKENEEMFKQIIDEAHKLTDKENSIFRSVLKS